MPKEQNAEQIEAQITILERKFKGMTPQVKGYYALENKIKNLKVKLRARKSFEYLAQ